MIPFSLQKAINFKVIKKNEKKNKQTKRTK